MTHRNDLIPSGAVAVTPSDTTQLRLAGIRVADSGTVTVKGADGNSVLLEGFVGPETIAMGITMVMETGTTCTKITGFVP